MDSVLSVGLQVRSKLTRVDSYTCHPMSCTAIQLQLSIGAPLDLDRWIHFACYVIMQSLSRVWWHEHARASAHPRERCWGHCWHTGTWRAIFVALYRYQHALWKFPLFAFLSLWLTLLFLYSTVFVSVSFYVCFSFSQYVSPPLFISTSRHISLSLSPSLLVGTPELCERHLLTSFSLIHVLFAPSCRLCSSLCFHPSKSLRVSICFFISLSFFSLSLVLSPPVCRHIF